MLISLKFLISLKGEFPNKRPDPPLIGLIPAACCSDGSILGKKERGGQVYGLGYSRSLEVRTTLCLEDLAMKKRTSGLDQPEGKVGDFQGRGKTTAGGASGDPFHHLRSHVGG